MKSLKLRTLYSVGAVIAFVTGHPGAETHDWPAQGGPYSLTKVLVNASGSAAMTGGPYQAALAVGEAAAGSTLGPTSILHSGYFGGRFGAGAGFRLVSSQVGDPTRLYRQNGLQIGTALDAAVTLQFSDDLALESAAAGIVMERVVDHLGRLQHSPVPFKTDYQAAARTMRLVPDTLWEGNTLFEVRVTPQLVSAEGVSHDGEVAIRFLTLLEPARDNVVLHPLELAELAPAPQAGGLAASGNMSLHVPPDALSEKAMVLFNADPLNHSGKTPPDIIREANRKAAQAGGAYRTPVILHEISLLNANGESIPTLSKPAEISMSFETLDGWVQGLPAPVRSETMSIWALDEAHRLWVKLPDSRISSDGRRIAAEVPHFSIYALMGGPSGSAMDIYAFPNPWRPHGPAAGEAAGQTGSESGGITFTNLPSECTIRIYTLSGDRVRELRHSNLTGALSQERWDVRTDGGQPVASGVYLWRVESDTDSKTGKLMVIR